MLDSQYKKIVENFKLTIRRRQVNHILESDRRDKQRQLEEQFRQQLEHRLNRFEDRQTWIHQVASILSGEPNQQWGQLLKKLYYAIYLYQDNYEQWISLGIVKSICQLFQVDKFSFRLAKLTANILTDLLYMNSKPPPNFIVLKGIVKQEFGKSVIQLMIQHADVQYIRLVGSLFEAAPATRNYFINEKFLDWIKTTFEKLEEFEEKNSQQYIYSILYLVYQVLKTHQFDRDTFSHPKKSTILKLLSILSHQIEKFHTINNMILILSSVKEICRLKKPQIASQIFQHHLKLLTIPIQMLTSDSNQIKYASAKLLTNFSISDDPNHIQFLFQNSILDRIYDAYHQLRNNNEIKQMLLSLLSNLTADNLNHQQMVIMHPVMTNIILPQANDSSSSEIRNEAIYNICNILLNLPQSWFQKVVDQLKIFDALVSNISRTDRFPATVMDILNTWKQMIDNQIKLNPNRQSSCYRILKNHYHICDVLSECTQFDELEDKINDFINFFESLQQTN